MKIRRVTERSAVEAARALFDSPPLPHPTSRFLASTDHHLLVAYEGDIPTGFVTGVEMTHPDKGTEMFLYELGVSEAYRGRGIGKALVSALGALARDNGCYGMWVLTDEDNDAALATYAAAGGARSGRQVMLSWTLDPQVTQLETHQPSDQDAPVQSVAPERLL